MNKLEEICQKKREHVAAQKAVTPLAALKDQLQAAERPRGFQNALKAKIARHEIGLIAEVKKASPSRGIIRADFEPASLAKSYQNAGASCVSVLTDTPYFQGNDAFLQQVKRAVSLPVLRKDFMIDPYQIYESRALGADCILLIMAALSDTQATDFEAISHELGMDVLIEVHDEAELTRALASSGSTLLGVNNRSLKTLKVDLATTEQLASRIPSHYTTVCESGIATHEDIVRMQQSHISCFLVGESLMREPDVERATKQLLGKPL